METRSWTTVLKICGRLLQYEQYSSNTQKSDQHVYDIILRCRVIKSRMSDQ